MTIDGERISERWREDEFVRGWLARNDLDGLLALPRALAAAIVAQQTPDARLVMDVASGPGTFLAAFLDELPAARGVWTDASEAMLATARERLARFGDRVDYVLADMTDLAAAELPERVDVVLSSRATHHLGAQGLARFYHQAAERLAPGGWLINIDRVRLTTPWDDRIRAARERLLGARPREGRVAHHHAGPPSTVGEHLDAFGRAGIADAETPWRAFHLCLFMGRAPSG